MFYLKVLVPKAGTCKYSDYWSSISFGGPTFAVERLAGGEAGAGAVLSPGQLVAVVCPLVVVGVDELEVVRALHTGRGCRVIVRTRATGDVTTSICNTMLVRTSNTFMLHFWTQIANCLLLTIELDVADGVSTLEETLNLLDAHLEGGSVLRAAAPAGGHDHVQPLRSPPGPLQPPPRPDKLQHLAV